jgi:hypothetical protein
MNVNIDAPSEELWDIESKKGLYNVYGTYYGKNNTIEKMAMNKAGYNCGREKTEYDFFDPICQNMKDDSINPSLIKNKHGFPHLILGLMMFFWLIVYFSVNQKMIQPVSMKIKGKS